MSEGNGNLPNSWVWAKMDEIREPDAPIIYGILQPGPDQSEGVYYVRPTEIVDDEIQIAELRKTTSAIAERYKRSTLKAGDTLLSIVGTIGKVAAVSAELDGANITQSSVRIRANDECIEPRFVRQALKAPPITRQFEKHRLGTGVPRLNVGHVRELDIPLPPLPEQRRIVAKIEALQEQSRKAREALAEVGPLLEQFRQSLLAAAFRGDLTADWRAENPDVEPARELLARIRTERRQKWEQAELAKYKAKGKKPPKNWQDKYKEPEPVDETKLPELPEGWCWVSLGELTLIDSGEAFKKKDYSQEGIRLFQIANVSFGHTLWEQQNFLPESFAESHRHLMLERTDILIALNRPILDGRLKVTKLSDDDLPAILYQRVGRMRLAISEIADYLFAFMRSPSMLRQVERKLQGSDQPYINTSDIPRIVVPLPPADEIAEVVRFCLSALDSVHDQFNSVRDAEADLDQLDQSILAKAFRGELVPQDSTDEPAAVLLERIRQQREAAAQNGKPKRKTKRTSRKKKA